MTDCSTASRYERPRRIRICVALEGIEIGRCGKPTRAGIESDFWVGRSTIGLAGLGASQVGDLPAQAG